MIDSFSYFNEEKFRKHQSYIVLGVQFLLIAMNYGVKLAHSLCNA